MVNPLSDLLTNPICTPGELGKPIPDSPYAVSTCLPTWADAVGYEEREPHVINALEAGYPRFVYHPLCQTLFDRCAERHAADGQHCLVLVSRGAAERFARFVGEKGGGPCGVFDLNLGGEHAVCFDEADALTAKQYWQHTGEGVSARQAENALSGRAADPADGVKHTLRQRIAECAGVSADDVWLFPTGMTGIYTLHRALLALRPGGRGVQLGFPYVDTLKVLQKFGPGAAFFPSGDDNEFDKLAGVLANDPACGLFTEVPSNPLLVSPDLARLRELADEHDTPLVVDDTVATWVNVELTGVADVLCTSLTKFFSGMGDVAGGALVVCPQSKWAERLRKAMGAAYEDTLFGPDAVVLEANSRDFVERVRKINTNAERVADHLAAHPKVAQVHYPKFATPERYGAWRKPDGGYGGLMSIDLKDPADHAPNFYDKLRLCKGPNLGTNYTLACPYTILAHFDELQWAESCGVSRWLVRLSVGLEDADDLVERLDEALS